jgi:hypothetical protein
MAISKTNSKMQSTDAEAGSKPATKSKVETVTTTAPAGGQAQAVKQMLTRIETKMKDDQMNATLGDYIRLVQLHKELDDESPKEIRVTWVEPAEKGSAKEE